MEYTAPAKTAQPDPAHLVREITLDHPWRWIAAGWSDFKRAPALSLFYGSMFVLAGYLLVFWSYAAGRFFLVPPITASFFLVAPLLGIGFYDVSRRLQHDEQPSVRHGLEAWHRNLYNLLVMGLILMLVMLAWMMVANLVFVIFYTGLTPPLDNLLNEIFLSGKSPLFLAMGMISGSFFALAVFSISLVSVPMLMDRKVDVLTTILTSFEAVKKNPRPLALWAALIVMFIGLGLISFFIGLAVFVPLMGYASWHAYLDLVSNGEPPSVDGIENPGKAGRPVR